jgi:GNAT superfamily N-acetyltransferase
MGLEVRAYERIDDFESHALPFLMEREAEHNLFLGICSQIRAGRYKDFYLATVERDGAVVAAAFRTPPFQVGLSHVADPAAIDRIADHVLETYGSVPGILAPRDDALAFAKAWQSRTGSDFHVAIRQRIYEARDVSLPPDAPGEIRPATMAERDLVISWFRGRNEEALGSDAVGPDVDPEVLADWRIGGAAGPLMLWWTDHPVSMAGASGPTPNGIRINAVYTPPEHRRNGYASACVANLTRQLLDDGRRFCFLYTDLANPTSNSIYQKVGYRPVCDVDQYRFIDPSS